MKFLVKVKVNISKMAEFGQKLQKGELDRSLIKSETYCLKNDPVVGYSIWEAVNLNEFEKIFSMWKVYYQETEVSEIIQPEEAMKILFSKI
jgi:hypothetical protein